MPIAAIIGTGLVGQGWAIVFARMGWTVKLFDPAPARLASARTLILQQLDALENHGLVEDAARIAGHIEVAESLAAALAGARHVQESSPENVDIKKALFSELDALAGPDAILASSTSSIPASQFTEHLAGRARCLVAHPVNPPYLIPVVEISGAPWTSAEAVERARQIMLSVGQKPVVVNREIEGFVLNRLQGALLQEAFRLVAAGICSAEDVDTTIKDGLGLRWSFMGPFETIDLNAPGGIADYCARYGGMYKSIGASQADCAEWDEALIARLSTQRRALLAETDLPERRVWRDEKLMQLMRHKQEGRDQ
jgi:L-gulonate 3-dehydrogenase